MTSGATLLSFVTCVSDDVVLRTNLLASRCLAADSAHQVLVIKNCPSAADGLNIRLERAESEFVVCVHQDVLLPAGWDRCLAQQLHEAEQRFGPIGVAGVYGVGEVFESGQFDQLFAAERIGGVVDRGRLLRDGPELPAQVATLDELLLVVRSDPGLRFDPDLGFHLYGADICLQARERGLAVVALGALCHHNSRSVGLPEAFYRSAEVFARKWQHRLPVATPCVIIDRAGDVYLLGDATNRPGSVALAERRRRPGSTAEGKQIRNSIETSIA
jgi:Glycosyltransferase like family